MTTNRDLTDMHTPDNDNDSWPPHEFFPKLPWTCDGEISTASDGSTQYTIELKVPVNSGGAEAYILGTGSTREEAYSDLLKTCGELFNELFVFMMSQIS